MLNKYRDSHINRIIEATTDLYKQPGSICRKCHDGIEHINCIFCYCPLYELDECGGDYTILSNGIKDCSNCIRPHTPEFVKEYIKRAYK